MKIPSSLRVSGLLGLVATGLFFTSARAEVVVEWSFQDLSAGDKAEKVASALPGGPALTQPTDYRSPYVVNPESADFPGTALEFYSDQKQFLQAPADGPYNFGADDAFAIEVLLKIYTYAPTEGTARQIIMKRARTGTYPGWSLAVLGDGSLVMAMAAEGKPAKVIKTRTPLPLNEWIQIAGTRTDDGRIALYINGDQVAEGATHGLDLTNDMELFVGKHSGAENPGFYFDGLIQAVRISKGDFTIKADDLKK